MLSGSVRIDGRRIEGRFSFAAWALRLRLESVSGTPREFLFTAEPGKRRSFIASARGVSRVDRGEPANYRRRRIRRSRPVSTPLLVDTRVK
jgi:hypothetical protein